jgi:aquaporin Z
MHQQLNDTSYVWKSLLSEFIGTFVLVLIVCLAVGLNTSIYPQSANDSLAGALAYGLTFMTLIYIMGSYSGAHLNPAISFGFAVSGRMHWGLLLGYWIAQFLGAIAAAGLVAYFLSGVPQANNLFGASTGYLTQNNQAAAFLLEMFLTFILVLVVLFVTRNPFLSLIGGLAIGLVLTFEYLAAAPLTGASMNPARSLGPAIFTSGQWGSYWIYIVGPLTGALIAALVFKLFTVEWGGTVKKDSCGKVITDSCGNPIKEYKRKVLDKCGKPVKDECGQVKMESYAYHEPKLSHHQETLPMAVGKWMTERGLNPQYLAREFKVAVKQGKDGSSDLSTSIDPHSVVATRDTISGVAATLAGAAGGAVGGALSETENEFSAYSQNNVSSDNGRTYQTPSDNGRTYQTPSDNGRTYQTPSDNGRPYQTSLINARNQQNNSNRESPVSNVINSTLSGASGSFDRLSNVGGQNYRGSSGASPLPQIPTYSNLMNQNPYLI